MPADTAGVENWVGCFRLFSLGLHGAWGRYFLRAQLGLLEVPQEKMVSS